MKNILIIAGEASGDLHGAALIKEMRKLNGEILFWGIGGDYMISAGLNNFRHIREVAFLDFVEVVKHIPLIKKIRRQTLAAVNEHKIDSAILIDYPGFNLSIAKKLKRLGLKIYYYISPQIWAWGQGRIKKIKKLVDKMIVIFPFEKEFYEKEGVNVEFVGHPLMKRIAEYPMLSREDFFEKNSLDPEMGILLIMPGSRIQEIERIFPVALESASKIAGKYNLQIVTACAENIEENIFSRLTTKTNFKLVQGFTYELLKYSKYGIIKSGTSTLEAGLFALPFTVVYVTSTLSYVIGRRLIKIDNIAMVNIMLGRQVIDELVQNDVTVANISSSAERILSDSGNYLRIKSELRELGNKLGSGNAAANAAKIIVDDLNESP